MLFRSFYFRYICEEVNHSESHHCHGTHLTDGIAGETHEQREHRATKKTHNHKTRNLILLGFIGEQSLREEQREDV